MNSSKRLNQWTGNWQMCDSDSMINIGDTAGKQKMKKNDLQKRL